MQGNSGFIHKKVNAQKIKGKNSKFRGNTEDPNYKHGQSKNTKSMKARQRRNTGPHTAKQDLISHHAKTDKPTRNTRQTELKYQRGN